MVKKWMMAGLTMLPALLVTPSWAEEVAQVPAAVATVASVTINKGDNTWMLLSAALVILMSIPGLALFYGGLVRAKNMLSVLMQVFTLFLPHLRALGGLWLFARLHRRGQLLRLLQQGAAQGGDP